jgi:hypothetical protein
LFYTLWNIGKWFLDPVTRDKVKPIMYLEGVEEYVDRRYIPKNMGGDRNEIFDPDSYPELWRPMENAIATDEPSTTAAASADAATISEDADK